MLQVLAEDLVCVKQFHLPPAMLVQTNTDTDKEPDNRGPPSSEAEPLSSLEHEDPSKTVAEDVVVQSRGSDYLPPGLLNAGYHKPRTRRTNLKPALLKSAAYSKTLRPCDALCQLRRVARMAPILA